MQARTKARLAAGILTALVLGSACGGGGGGGAGQGGSPDDSNGGGLYGGGGGDKATTGGGASVLTVDMNNYSFAPAKLSVKSGETITVRNANANTPHTFTVEGDGIDVANDPLASQDVVIDLAPGEFTFICRFHESQGMTGTLTVT